MESVKEQQNEKERRHRKILLLMPVIVVPMLAMGFHSLGGGKGVTGSVNSSAGTGLNTTLPDARFDVKKKVLTKLGFYEQADKDSVRLSERRKNDPYYSRIGGGFTLSKGDEGVKGWMKNAVSPGSGDGHPDQRARELLGKLDQLKGVLSRQEQGLSVMNVGGARRAGGVGEASAAGGEAPGVGGVGAVDDPRGADGAGEIGGTAGAGWRVRSLGATGRMSTVGGMDAVGGAGGAGISQGDPDLEKLNGIMDKILRIKYPDQERAQDTVAPAAERRSVSVVMAASKDEGMGELQTVEEKVGTDTVTDEMLEGSGFSELDDVPAGPVPENTVEAVVAHDQTLVSGESLDMRLAQEAVVGGVLMPAGTTFAGKASLSGERLQVTVSAIRLGNRVVPVSLEVVGLDGMRGIREPGSINRDAAKESADEAAGSLGVTSFDATLGGQAAAAGMQAAKSLLSRKIRLVRVSVPAGYRVLLINKKSLNH